MFLFKKKQKIPCQVCGYKTISFRGSYDICDVCYWEDDVMQTEAKFIEGGPNGNLSIAQARKNFKEFGAVEKKFIENVRKPKSSEFPE